MEDNNKKYWKGIEELSNDTEFVKLAQNEFPPYLSVKESTKEPEKTVAESDDVMASNRRDFLKMMGFGLAAVSLAACEAPVRKAIPYLNKPEEIEPTIPNYYASTYMDSSGDYSSILVRTNEGRPIKIEPNTLSSITPAGTSTRAQAAPLNLYDVDRLKGAWDVAKNKGITWQDADARIRQELQRIAGQGGAIRIVSSSIISPTTKRVIQDFITAYPGTQHIMYDATSASGMIKANNTSFGRAVIPSYNFANAAVIVGINSDFLGTDLNSSSNGYQYAQTRRVGKNKKEMSRHYQFETRMSLTGANADYRTPIKPSQEGLVVAALYNRVAKLAGGTSVSVAEVGKMAYLDEAARDLFNAKGRAVILSGSNDVNVQLMVNAINNLLGAYTSIIDLNAPYNLKQGDDAAMATFVQEVRDGRVGAVIFYNANPVYNYPAADLAQNLKKVGLKISFASKMDETAALTDIIAPDHNFLESWNDAEPKRGYYSLVQPTINPIFKTRAAQESLLTWAGKPQDFYSYLRSNWQTTMFPQQTGGGTFENFWVKAVHDGVFEPNKTKVPITSPVSTLSPAANTQTTTNTASGGTAFNADLTTVANAINTTYKPNTNTIELTLYEKIGIGNGEHANNPYLLEFPDPISRACWDNYLAVSQKTARDLDLVQSDVVRVEAKGKPTIEIPVLVQPGQADGTVSLAVGYGRTKAGRAGNNVGKNAFPFATYNGTTLIYIVPDVKITKTGEQHEIAQVQTHHTIMARPIVQEAKLAAYQSDPAAGRYKPKIATPLGPKKPGEITMWDEHTKPNHSWGMVIDLNSCIGCGACVVACNVENNIPVVGRREVINRREMHWLRIDRYYSSDGKLESNVDIAGYKSLEEASANPEVVFQPMLCQHCSNAPCETVCPVIATAHSSEGLNMMAYNRCIGTRYCANNCPYKVRRFNWFKYHNNEKFDYHMNNDLGKMVLNPDVTVRSRGVMEKCTFCVQRIQAGKLEAKKQRRRPVDGEINTACAGACPTNAIVFGDFLDPESRVARLREEEYEKRAFEVLEEINTKPQISYLTKIRNKA